MKGYRRTQHAINRQYGTITGGGGRRATAQRGTKGYPGGQPQDSHLNLKKKKKEVEAGHSSETRQAIVSALAETVIEGPQSGALPFQSVLAQERFNVRGESSEPHVPLPHKEGKDVKQAASRKRRNSKHRVVVPKRTPDHTMCAITWAWLACLRTVRGDERKTYSLPRGVRKPGDCFDKCGRRRVRCSWSARWHRHVLLVARGGRDE